MIFRKIVATVLAAALAASTMTVSAYAAQDEKKQPVVGFGILPAVGSPLAGLLISPESTTFVKNFKFFKWQSWGWQKIHYLKSTGWEVDKKIIHRYKVKVHAERTERTNFNQGKFVVGCIMGSALGAITAAVRKGNSLGNPLRWRSQAEHEAIVKSGYEKQFELTNNEAATAVSLCGLGSLALHWQQAPAVVKARY